MSSEPTAATAAAARSRLEAAADLGGADHRRPPPEIRVDDEDGSAAACKLAPPPSDAAAGGERRRSMPANHGPRFVDEPYVFSMSQALALTSRRRSEPLSADASAAAGTRETASHDGAESSASPHPRVFVDQTASGGNKHASTETGKMDDRERLSTTRATPKTVTTTAAAVAVPALDELSPLKSVAGASSLYGDDSDEEQATVAAVGSRFLSLPQTSDYLTVPARRHSVALAQPTTSRLLDVIAEETVATESRNLASSRRYSLSCQFNT